MVFEENEGRVRKTFPLDFRDIAAVSVLEGIIFLNEISTLPFLYIKRVPERKSPNKSRAELILLLKKLYVCSQVPFAVNPNPRRARARAE